MDENDNTNVPLDRLARVYRKMQGKKQSLTAVYESEVAAIDAQLDAVKVALKDLMLGLGVKSVNTLEGTVILSTKTRYSMQDWDAFKDFVVRNDALDLFEKRIAQTNMAAFLKDNPELVPPGLNTNSEYAISVRKPT